MSLSRSFLKSLNLNDDQISAVIEAHSETVTGLNGRYADLENKFNELNQRYSAAKADAEKLPGVLKELESDGVPRPALSFEEEDQISLADMAAEELRRTLRDLDLNTLTPIEAMNLLFELQRKARS